MTCSVHGGEPGFDQGEGGRAGSVDGVVSSV